MLNDFGATVICYCLIAIGYLYFINFGIIKPISNHE